MKRILIRAGLAVIVIEIVASVILTLVFGMDIADAANPHAQYTCTKNGATVTVPAPAVSGLENGGWTCTLVEDDETDPEDPGTDPGDEGEDGDDPAVGAAAPVVVDAGPRTLFCSLTGPQPRADGTMGIALDLFNLDGQQLVEAGVARPARFYVGIGATCDRLPGWPLLRWVDNVGEIVPGVEVYPLYLPQA